MLGSDSALKVGALSDKAIQSCLSFGLATEAEAKLYSRHEIERGHGVGREFGDKCRCIFESREERQDFFSYELNSVQDRCGSVTWVCQFPLNESEACSEKVNHASSDMG